MQSVSHFGFHSCVLGFVPISWLHGVGQGIADDQSGQGEGGGWGCGPEG
jgi:hypothetical protein